MSLLQCVLISAVFFLRGLASIAADDWMVQQRSLARHFSDIYAFDESIEIQKECLQRATTVYDKISLYSDLVDNLVMLESYPVPKWCEVVRDMEAILHATNSSYPWGNLDGTLPETVPRGNAIYYALYRAAEECQNYKQAWAYLMKALDMERKGRHMQMVLSTNKYLFHDKLQNFISISHYLHGMGVHGDPSVTFPIIVMGSSRSAAALVSRILGGHDAIFSLPMELSRLDHAIRRRVDRTTAQGVFTSRVGEFIDRVIGIAKQGVSANSQAQMIKTLFEEEYTTLLRFNFGIGQMVAEDGPDSMRYYVEYIGENVQYLSLLRLFFPNAIVLNIVNDPLDTMMDLLTERSDQSSENTFFTLHPPQAAKFIAIYENILSFIRKELKETSQHYKPITDVRFSDVLSNPVEVLQKAVLSPLNLQWQASMTRSRGIDGIIGQYKRKKGISRKYMDNGDISMYQATVYHFYDFVKLSEDWTLDRSELPFSNTVRWDMGPQVTWRHDGCKHIDMPIPTRRDDIGAFLNSLDLSVGAELGVQIASYSDSVLSKWTNCKKYYLIDVWNHQESNYMDSANVNSSMHNTFYAIAQRTLRTYRDRTELIFLRKLTSEAVADIPDNSLDFVYVDARHDYCSVTEDLSLYWPKLKEGGIMAGHDYMLGSALKEFVEVDFTDRFDMCPNGTIRERSVKGAVDDFAVSHNLQLAVTYHDQPPFLSFLMRKPCDGKGINNWKTPRGHGDSFGEL